MASANDSTIPDALAALEMAMRPHSVPSWLTSDSVHAPKITTLGPRRPDAEYRDPKPLGPFDHALGTTSTCGSTCAAAGTMVAPSMSNATLCSSSTSSTSTGSCAAATSIRPHAPIGCQKEKDVMATKDRHENSSWSLPKRSRRAAQQDVKSRRITQSVSESLQSLHLFDKTTNRSRELGTTSCLLRTFDDPEGNVHFVNIDEEEKQKTADKMPSTTPKQPPLRSPQEQQQQHSLLDPDKPVGRASPSAEPVHEGTMFHIPELPRGKHLVFNILSTWGDPFYVGLMGIEIFDHTGHAAFLSDVDRQLSADPADLNTMNAQAQAADPTATFPWDPRTVDKLVDGHYFTCDELHSWVAPFTRGQNHFIYFDLDETISLSMIRIWNYNGTRIHSYRCARYIEITLDGKFIFKGEICRAPGSVLDGVEACHECILFTTSLSILKVIEKYDKAYRTTSQLLMSANEGSESALSAGDENDNAPARVAASGSLERPSTADRNKRAKRMQDSRNLFKNKSCLIANGEQVEPEVRFLEQDLELLVDVPAKMTSIRPTTAPTSSDAAVNSAQKPVLCKKVSIVIEANWGDPFEVGIAGIQFLDPNESPIQLEPENVVSCPFALERFQLMVSAMSISRVSIGGGSEDMWCAPLKNCLETRPNESNFEPKSISIEFERPTALGALKIWNYNASLEDSFKGVKFISIFCDGQLLPVKKNQSVLVRKAPGKELIGFAQSIPLVRWFGDRSGRTEESSSAGKSLGSMMSNTPSLLDKQQQPTQVKTKTEAKRSQDTSQETMTAKSSRHTMRTMKPILEVTQQYQTPLYPSGCIIKFVFLSTWGDRFYLGLNGIELYDEHNTPIALGESNVNARPRDINVLRECESDRPNPIYEKDVRTLDKLYDGINNTYDDRHMWISPWTPNQCNYLFIYFDSLVTLSKVLLWNYSKTPARGVKEYEIFMDDVLIYHGIMKKAPAAMLGPDQEQLQCLAGGAEIDMCECVLFTDDPSVVENELDHIYLPQSELEESVTFFCDGQEVVSLKDAMLERETLSRPMTKAGSRPTDGRRALSS